jgi:hypothetical protein
VGRTQVSSCAGGGSQREGRRTDAYDTHRGPGPGWLALAALIGAATIVTAAAAPSQAADSAALQALAPPSLFTWGDEALGDLGNGSSAQANSRFPSASLR